MDFDEEGARAFHGDGDGGSDGVGFAFFEELSGGVCDFFEAFVFHLEDADFVAGAETVFHNSEHAELLEAVAFELHDGVDEMFEGAGAGEVAIFGDMADDD